MECCYWCLKKSIISQKKSWKAETFFKVSTKLFSWKIGGMHGIFLLLKKALRIVISESFKNRPVWFRVSQWVIKFGLYARVVILYWMFYRSRLILRGLKHFKQMLINLVALAIFKHCLTWIMSWIGLLIHGGSLSSHVIISRVM